MIGIARALPEGSEVSYVDHNSTWMREAFDNGKLPGVYALPHADSTLTSYLLVPESEAALIVGVPKAERESYESVRRACATPSMLVVTERSEGEAQLSWLKAFPGMRRVVHRQDAGRGAYRRDEKDWLLSAGDDLRGRAKTKMDAKDIGKERIRRLDDGPWRLSPTTMAKWCPGFSLGSIVVHHSSPQGNILFSGRVCGLGENDDLDAFPLETDHSVKELVKSLRSLADESPEWDFEWLVPARGHAVHFPSSQDARQALREAADRAESFLAKDNSTSTSAT